MRYSLRSELPQVAILLGMFTIGALAWARVSEPLPIHWGPTGEVDRWGGRFEALILPPILASALYVVMLLAPRFDPARANYESFKTPYLIVRLAALAGLATLHVTIVLAGMGLERPTSHVFLLVLGGLLLGAGSVLGKVRPNLVLGIRTPWTLGSKRSWVRTHRAGGWVFLAAGLLFVLAGLMRSPWTVGLAVTFGVASVVGLLLYSYRVWRSDPERIPALSARPASDC